MIGCIHTKRAPGLPHTNTLATVYRLPLVALRLHPQGLFFPGGKTLRNVAHQCVVDQGERAIIGQRRAIDSGVDVVRRFG